MKSMETLLSRIDAVSEWTGRWTSYLIIPGTVILALEVALRYVFNSPTMWAHGATQRIFAIYYIISGAYVLRHNSHIAVDIIYVRFPPRIRAVFGLLGCLFIFIFCGVLLWKGSDFAWTSISSLEPDDTPWRAPIYPVKVMLPLGAMLVLLQGAAKFIRDLRVAIYGEITDGH